MESNLASAAPPQATRCLRCGRKLTATDSVRWGYGPTCRTRIARAAQVADLGAFHGWQVDKARDAIAEQAVIPSSRPGIYAAVSGDGTTIYLVNAREGTCTCRAARACYHLAAAAILDASATVKPAA